MILACALTLDHELIDRRALQIAPRREHVHLRFVILQLMDDRAPAAQPADIFISRGTIDKLQQRRRTPLEDREEKAKTERVGVLANRFSEEPRGLAGHLAQRFLLAVLSRPD